MEPALIVVVPAASVLKLAAAMVFALVLPKVVRPVLVKDIAPIAPLAPAPMEPFNEIAPLPLEILKFSAVPVLLSIAEAKVTLLFVVVKVTLLPRKLDALLLL